MILQPFQEFKVSYIERLRTLKKRFIVTQTYERGQTFCGSGKIPLLLTDYDDKGLARVHINAVKDDRFAAIIDLENSKHREKLIEMAEEGSAYALFWAVVRSAKEIEERVNKVYTDAIRRYIQTNTNWRVGRDTTIRPNLQSIFGTLHLILKYGSQTLRVNFEEIEKFA